MLVEKSPTLHDLNVLPLILDALENLLQTHINAPLFSAILLMRFLVFSTQSYHISALELDSVIL